MTNGAILDSPAEKLADGEAPMMSGDVLRRIIARSRRIDPPSAPAEVEDPSPPTAERAASVALSRAAERLHGLPIFTQTAEIQPVTLSELAELLPEQALLAVIGGKGDRLGVVALCPSVIASLIEIQAVGRLSSRPVRTRKPTRTDALIAADFVNALLQEMGRELGRAELSGIDGFTYSSFLDDPRPLMLMLEDVPMTRLTLRCRLGSGGQRDGQVLIALPATLPPPSTSPGGGSTRLLAQAPTASPSEKTHSPEPVAEAVTDETLASTVRDASIELVGVLCRKTLTLGMLRNLAPGDLIALPAGALDETRLETAQGQLLAEGRLGDADGYHAIRLKGGTQDAMHEMPSGLVQGIDINQPDAFRHNAGLSQTEQIDQLAQGMNSPSFGRG